MAGGSASEIALAVTSVERPYRYVSIRPLHSHSNAPFARLRRWLGLDRVGQNFGQDFYS